MLFRAHSLNIAAVNNKASGVALGTSFNGALMNLAVTNNGEFGLYSGASSNNRFMGIHKTGNNSIGCYGGGSGIGFNNDCSSEGASTAVVNYSVTLAESFVGKVTADDTANASDTAGTATFPAVSTFFDWLSFDNAFRGWGIDGSAFPNADNQTRWLAGTGRIWDWSLLNGDTGDAGSPAIQSVLAAQLNGNVASTAEHAWAGVAADQAACTVLIPGSVWNAADDCRSTYLRNATEILIDDIGNDNGLCESGETCLFTPNIGAYQGHGVVESAGVFVDGDTLTGITLKKYSLNGY